MSYLDEMTAAYLECAKWAEEPDGEPDRERWKQATFTKAAQKRARMDCVKFLGIAFARSSRDAFAAGEYDASQMGHDFWLTRNRHGAGFWDRTDEVYPKHVRDLLTECAHEMGECYIHESRKRLHLEGGR